jgi:hypothetical protein
METIGEKTAEPKSSIQKTSFVVSPGYRSGASTMKVVASWHCELHANWTQETSLSFAYFRVWMFDFKATASHSYGLCGLRCIFNGNQDLFDKIPQML